MSTGISRPYIVINNLYAMGGAERNVLNVFRTTQAQARKPVIVTSQESLPGEPFEVLRTLYVGEKFSPGSALVWTLTTTIRIILAAIQKTRQDRREPSIIHGYMSIPAGLVAVLAGRLLHRPSVVSIQGQDLFFFRSTILGVLHQLVLQHADHIITQTTWQKNYILRRVPKPPQAITVLPNGVSVPPTYSPLPAVKNKTCFRLLFLGRFIPQKRPLDAIEAIQLVSQMNPQITVTLTMVGCGPLEPSISTKIRDYGLDQRVGLKTAVPHTKISDLIQQHDAIVLPSVSEGMPNVVLEGMALGRPVLVTEFPGVREYVTDNVNGLISKTEDPVQLAQHILELAEAPLKAARLGANGRAYVLETLELSRITARQLRLYDKVRAKDAVVSPNKV